MTDPTPSVASLRAAQRQINARYAGYRWELPMLLAVIGILILFMLCAL